MDLAISARGSRGRTDSGQRNRSDVRKDVVLSQRVPSAYNARGLDLN